MTVPWIPERKFRSTLMLMIRALALTWLQLLLKFHFSKLSRTLLLVVYVNFASCAYSPMIEIGFLAKRSLPHIPTYLLRHPADHNRTTYSVPKNTTNTIS